MKKVIAAGGVVFRSTKNKIEVALIRDPYGKLAFAKGHLEGKESVEEAALREVTEEMGCGQAKIIGYLGEMSYSFKDEYMRDGAMDIEKTVHFYLMRLDPDQKCTPQKEEGIEEIVWVEKDKLLERIGYDNLEEITRKALKLISNSPNF